MTRAVVTSGLVMYESKKMSDLHAYTSLRKGTESVEVIIHFIHKTSSNDTHDIYDVYSHENIQETTTIKKNREKIWKFILKFNA